MARAPSVVAKRGRRPRADAAAGTQAPGQGSSELLDTVFVITLPFVVLTMPVLGVVLLVKRFRPALPAVLLAAAFPLALVITEVTSMGNIVLPIAFAFGILGRRTARGPVLVRAEVPAAAPM